MAKPTITTPAPRSDLVAADFVYTGMVPITGGQLAHRINIILSNGSLAVDRIYKIKRKRSLTVGGVYTGVKFNATQSMGLDDCRFLRMWGDAAYIIKWTAESQAWEAQQRMEVIEASQRQRSTIDCAMAPIARVYNDLRGRGDHIGCQALEAAVLRALRRPPRT